MATREGVVVHQVLGRLAERFAIPGELMGLSWWGPGGTYCGEVPVTAEAGRMPSSCSPRCTYEPGAPRAGAGPACLLGGLATTSLHTPAPVMAALGTGLFGALTTYSTFGYETVRLMQDRARLFAVINAAARIIAGLGAAALGGALAQALGCRGVTGSA